MTWVSERNLVAAISNAGGFGVIASGSMSPELLSAEIAATRALTERPFGVNLITLHPRLIELIDVCAAHRVGHVVLAGGLPSGAAMSRIKQTRSAGVLLRAGARFRPQARAHGRRCDRHRGQRGGRPYRAGFDRGVGAGDSAASRRGAGVRRRRHRPRRSDAGLSRNGRGRRAARHALRLRRGIDRPSALQAGLHPRRGARRRHVASARSALSR